MYNEEMFPYQNGDDVAARSYTGSDYGFQSMVKVMVEMEDSASVGPPISDDGSITNPSIEYAESQMSLSSMPSSTVQFLMKVQFMENLLTEVFTTVSSLKAAYVQLQSAHVPYNPEKLQAADKAVIAELRKVSELKHAYKESLSTLNVSEMALVGNDSAIQQQKSDSEPGLQMLKSYESMIENLRVEVQHKNTAMVKLKDSLTAVTFKKDKLERRLSRLEQKLIVDSVAGTLAIASMPTPQLMESAVVEASNVSRHFTKLLVSLMKAAKWDLDAAAKSIVPDMAYLKKAHKKLAFESYISQRLLSGFESETFNLGVRNEAARSRHDFFSEYQELKTADPVKLVRANPLGLFGKYCLKKFLDAIHPSMEESFFGSLKQRKQILTGNHPDTDLYHSFVKLARAMWLLHRLAFSFEPAAHMFQAKRNTEFSPPYMESVVNGVSLDTTDPGAKAVVGFTVMPGFRIQNTIIKCQVYISGVRPSDHADGDG